MHNWNNRIRFCVKIVTMIRSGQYFINNGCSFVIVNFEYFNGKGEDLEQRGNTSQKTLFTGT